VGHIRGKTKMPTHIPKNRNSKLEIRNRQRPGTATVTATADAGHAAAGRLRR
jgi:hypothetical protein